MDPVSSLKQALPYIQQHHGKTFVVTLGSRAMVEPDTLRKVGEDISLLHSVGIRIVVVHGGGVYIDKLARELGLDGVTVGGRTVVNDRHLDLAKMLSRGKVNVEVVAALREAGALAVGVSGGDGGLITATRVRDAEAVDEGDEPLVSQGHIGEVAHVDPTLITTLTEAGYIPVVSSIATTNTGGVLAIFTDSMAEHLAVALDASKLFFLTDRAGVLAKVSDPNSLISWADIKDMKKLLDQGDISGGMAPKIQSAIQAIENGVPRVHLINAHQPSSLLLEVFTHEGAGTLIVRDKLDLEELEE